MRRSLRGVAVAAVLGMMATGAAGSASASLGTVPGGSYRAEAAREEVSSRPRRSAVFDDSVLAVAYHSGVIFVAGRFRAARESGTTTDRSHLAAVDADSGRLLDWAPATDGAVLAVVATADAVYVAGDFGRIGGHRRAGLAKLDAGTGEVDPEFDPVVSGRIRALAVGDGRLYLGGSLTSVDGEWRAGLAAVTLGTGALDQDWTPAVDDTVYTLATSGARVYVGGTFGEVNGSPKHRKFAAVEADSGALVTDFEPGMSVLVRDVTVASDTVYAAVGGTGGRLIAFDSAGGQRWAVTGDGDFQAVTTLGDTVYAGGHFGMICNSPRTDPDGTCLDGSAERGRMAAFDSDGNLLGWSPDADSAVGVHDMTSGAGAVAVGGEFTTLDSGRIEQPYFAAFR